MTRALLPECESDARIKDSGVNGPYMDQTTRRSHRKYLALLRRLHSRGIIRYGCDARGKVGCFTVRKKNGDQRLVIDCRRTNAHFGPPKHVNLATGASFGEICVDESGPIWIGGVDIEVAFYAIGLPEDLCPCFS